MEIEELLRDQLNRLEDRVDRAEQNLATNTRLIGAQGDKIKTLWDEKDDKKKLYETIRNALYGAIIAFVFSAAGIWGAVKGWVTAIFGNKPPG